MVRKCKIIKIKGSPVHWDLTKKFARGAGFGNFLKFE